MTTERLAAAFVDALAIPDVDALRSLLAPDARFWVNIGSMTFSADERFALLEVERSHLDTISFDDVRVQQMPAGFVVQLTTVMTTTGGIDLEIPVCLFVRTAADSDLITRVDEYADSAPAAPLLDAMSGGS